MPHPSDEGPLEAGQDYIAALEEVLASAYAATRGDHPVDSHLGWLKRRVDAALRAKERIKGNDNNNEPARVERADGQF